MRAESLESLGKSEKLQRLWLMLDHILCFSFSDQLIKKFAENINKNVSFSSVSRQV